MRISTMTLVAAMAFALQFSLPAHAAVSFASPQHYPGGEIPTGMTFGDVNHDLILDVVVANSTSNNVHIRFGVGDGTFGPATVVPTHGAARDAVIGDVTGDGLNDIAVALRTGEFAMDVIVNTGSNTFAPAVGSGNLIFEFITAFSMIKGDLDLDGDLDAGIVHSTTGGVTVQILLNDGAGGFSPGVDAVISSTFATYIGDIETADMDGDGDLDLVGSAINDGTVALVRNDGSGVFGPPESVGFGDVSPSGLALGDMDGNGTIDVVIADSTFDAPDRIGVAFNDGTGSFSAPVFSLSGNVTTAFTSPVALAVADVDRDDATDVVLAGRVLRNVGSGFSEPVSFAISDEMLTVAVGDLDQDGDPEIAYATAPLIIPGELLVLENLADPNAACDGDANDDQIIGVTDLLSLLSAWGACTDCISDLNNDMIVDVMDLLALLASWGPC